MSMNLKRANETPRNLDRTLLLAHTSWLVGSERDQHCHNRDKISSIALPRRDYPEFRQKNFGRGYFIWVLRASGYLGKIFLFAKFWSEFKNSFVKFYVYMLTLTK